MNDINIFRSTKKLLMVDDDRLVLATIAVDLREAGYSVATVESSDEAEAWLAGGNRPDLAILDIQMAGNDGLYLARRLNDFDHIPFIILSAYSDEKFVEQATQSGALGYVVKPLDTAKLVPVIEAAIARAGELHELRETRQQLQKALDAERIISVATGIVMTEYKLKRSDAFTSLRDSARKRRRKLIDVANEIVIARETLNLDLKQQGKEIIPLDLKSIDL